MQISQDYNPERYYIRSYTVNEIVVIPPVLEQEVTGQDRPAVRDITLNTSCIVTPGRLIRDWPPRDINDLRAEYFDVVAEMRPEVVLLGTGPRIRFPNPAHTAALMGKGIGVEVMDTAAACRTYNFLMADGRDVAAALLVPTP